MIFTRSIDEETYISRVRTMRAARAAIDSCFGADIYRLHNILETRKTGDFLYASWIFLINLIKLRPIPLQCVLYATHSDIHKLVSTLSRKDYPIIYLDTVRCLVLLRKLRKTRRDRKIIVDFDDLFSRRMKTVARTHMPLSLGFAQKYFPAVFRRAIEGPFAQLINRHEATTLPHAEIEIANIANSIVLVSKVERELLVRRLPPGVAAAIHAIPPPALVVRPSREIIPPLRFVFIGSDRQIHNRLSIDFLLHLWRGLTPNATLHIYGNQRSTPSVKNVVWHGFAPELTTVYSEGSISLLPALLAGGIKTKVIEAWTYGRPVLGNAAAFEGIQIPGYPLELPECHWNQFILSPERHISALKEASSLGLNYVATTLSPQQHRLLWELAINSTPVAR